MVVGKKTEPSSTNELTDKSPIFMKFGLLVRTVSRARFIRQREKMSALDSLENLQSITLLQVGAGSLCLSEIP